MTDWAQHIYTQNVHCLKHKETLFNQIIESTEFKNVGYWSELLWQTWKGLETVWKPFCYLLLPFDLQEQIGGGSVMVWGGISMEGCTTSIEPWTPLGIRINCLDTLSDPTWVQCALGLTRSTTMASLMW